MVMNIVVNVIISRIHWYENSSCSRNVFTDTVSFFERCPSCKLNLKKKHDIAEGGSASSKAEAEASSETRFFLFWNMDSVPEKEIASVSSNCQSPIVLN